MRAEIWTLDWESYWDQEYTLSKMTTDGYVLDPRFEAQGLGVRTPQGQYLYFTPDRIPQALALIPWERAWVLAQNTAFDAFICAHRYKCPPPKLWLDTLSMARYVLPLMRKYGLAALAQFFGLPPKGDEVVRTRGRRYASFTTGEVQKLAVYCKHDVFLAWEVFIRLLPRIPTTELLLIDHTIRMFTEPMLRLNGERLRAFLAATQARKAELLKACGLDTREALMSNDKFAAALEALGVQPPMKLSEKLTARAGTATWTWAFSKRDPEFKELLEHEDDRVVTLVEARLAVKSTGDETRTERLLQVADAGRPWPVLLQYSGAKTTVRWSGGNKQNPQNLRRGGALREAIEAPPGYVIVAVDSSQIEARCNAAESGENALLEIFAAKGDPYADLASEVYGRPISKKHDPLERQVGKTGILGLGYGMGAEKFQLALKTDPIMPIDMPLDFCEQVVGTYRRRKYPNIAANWRRMDQALRCVAQGVEQDFGGWFTTCAEGLRLVTGFTIKYANLRWVDANGERGWWYDKAGVAVRIYGAKVVENVTQHIARQIVAEQMLRIMQRKLTDRFGHRLVLMAHDEVVLVCPENTAGDLLSVALQIMHTPPSWAPVRIPVAAEGAIGRTYADAK